MNCKEVYKRLCKANGFYIRPFLRISSDKSVNAHNLYWKIEICQGAIDAYSEDEMALLLGHELAHLNWRDVFNIGNDWEREYKADRVGAKYMQKAGYSLSRALSKFDKMKQVTSASHPHPHDRRKALEKLV